MLLFLKPDWEEVGSSPREYSAVGSFSGCLFFLSFVPLPLRTHLDNIPLHLLGLRDPPLSLQSALGSDPGHLYTSMNEGYWILDTR